MNAGLDDLDAAAVAERLRVPAVAVLSTVDSTMDEVHRLAAAGAPAGTIVVADEQTAGRGRARRPWNSAASGGLWMTLLERPGTASGLEVLSLRLGLGAAPALEPFTDGVRVQVKWPNDLYAGPRKLAGILVEARWRDDKVEWVAIGIGVNIGPPAAVPDAAGVRPGTSRAELLDALVPALREAAAVRGALTSRELAAFTARDFARDRRTLQPAPGVARGITSQGELIIQCATDGGRALFRAGSLVFAAEAT